MTPISGPSVGGAAWAVLHFEKAGFYPAFALDLDLAARLEGKLILEPLVDRTRNLDHVGYTARFHATCQVHGVAPQIVDVLALADHACGDRPAVDADPELHRHSVLEGMLAGDV